MKASSAPAGRQPPDPQTAWGCLTTNLALPGFGSLMGRRVAGYFQAPLCALGLILTLTFGVKFMAWYFSNYARLNQEQVDPFAVLGEMWIQVRWALLGMALFAVSWLWALATSISLVRRAKAQAQAEQPGVPPRPEDPPGGTS